MPRGLTPQIKAYLSNDRIDMAHLVEMDFVQPVYYTDYSRDLSSQGNNYVAAGHFLDIASPSESAKLKVGSVNLILSGVEQSFISILQTQKWINRKIYISRAIISDAGDIVPNPFRIFEGQMTQYQVVEDDKSGKVTISIASHWADFKKKAGRFTNNNSQQYYYPNDKGMEYAPEIVRDIKWGRG